MYNPLCVTLWCNDWLSALNLYLRLFLSWLNTDFAGPGCPALNALPLMHALAAGTDAMTDNSDYARADNTPCVLKLMMPSWVPSCTHCTTC